MMASGEEGFATTDWKSFSRLSSAVPKFADTSSRRFVLELPKVAGLRLSLGLAALAWGLFRYIP
jgi:hypothetical protein